ncbi:MAG: hypothetical protein IT423_12040 [Pirellulaceae bacterium]|nr:hypothetical protein [Pirellulaceae bacterium]
MASRAPTLVKPKAKPKVTTKSIVAKPTAPKSNVALKPAATTLPKSLAKATSKPIVAKINPSKSVVSKNPLTKAKLIKTAVVDKSVVVPSKSDSIIAKASVAKAAIGKAPVAKAIKSAVAKAGVSPKAVTVDGPKVVGAASFEPAAPKPRRRTKGEVRTRIYWAVFNQALRRVAVFEFDQREEAEKRAAKLALASGEHHFIQKIKAIVQ